MRLDNARAVGLVALATLIFTLIFASAKLMGTGDLALQVMFFRYLSAFVCLAVAATRWGIPRSPRLRVHAVRALCGGGGGTAAIYAAAEMRIADATAIGLLDVVLAVLLGVVVLGERLDRRRVIASGISLAGALTVVLGQGAFHDVSALPLLPVGVALAGAMMIAVERLLIRVLSVAEPAFAVLFFVNLFGTLIFLPVGALTWHLSSPAQKLLMCLIGPAALAGQLCNILGYRLADIAIVAPVGYLWIVFAAALGWLVFAEPLTASTLSGSALIVAGGLLLTGVRRPPAR